MFFRGNINKRRPYAAGEPCSGCSSNFPYCSHNTCSDSDSNDKSNLVKVLLIKTDMSSYVAQYLPEKSFSAVPSIDQWCFLLCFDRAYKSLD